MPMRTELPTIFITWTTMSSPSMIFSPGRRVMMSIEDSSLESFWKCLGGDLGLGVGEQRGAHGGVRGLVDHLEALASGDDDRRAEVRAEVGELVRGADGDPDGHVVVLHAVAVGVRQLDLVVGEEPPRVGHGERQLRVVKRV